MDVKLIDYTRDAVPLLLYTKDTRLQGAQSLEDIKLWSEEKQIEHLRYMRDTIQSSWEFVNYTFQIDEVTRNFTHQLVRTRHGSYAQQSQRTVDVRDATVIGPNHRKFELVANHALSAYARMIDDGVPVQEARAVLPTGTTTSIIAKYDLRTLHNMALLRMCTRTQGEYQEVFNKMIGEVFDVHPWAEEFIMVHCAWYGTCAFPRYTECPVRDTVLPFTQEDRENIRARRAEVDHIANPKAKDGRTM